MSNSPLDARFAELLQEMVQLQIDILDHNLTLNDTANHFHIVIAGNQMLDFAQIAEGNGMTQDYVNALDNLGHAVISMSSTYATEKALSDYQSAKATYLAAYPRKDYHEKTTNRPKYYNRKKRPS